MKNNLFLLLVFIGLLVESSQAQAYDDYYGAGQTIGLTVTTSTVDGDNTGEHVVNGSSLVPDLSGAARFLGQASLGANFEEIDYVTEVGIKNWIEEQINMPFTPYLQKYQYLYQEISQLILAVHPGSAVVPNTDYLSHAFYEKVLKENDVLRNKVAFSLSQILVVSTTNNTLRKKGFGASSFYDILYNGAFDNYRDLLNDVTYHLLMGKYLSHLNNKKSNASSGTLPDENYAREIMQLFTIGLFELNLDGSHKLDAVGNPISTYDIVDVQEMAKIFTGLSGSAWNLDAFPQYAGTSVTFGKGFNKYDMTAPLTMYEDQHEPGAKILLNGTVIPAGQSGDQDIKDALDLLFNHPNVGPFLAKRLIQQMVKSNPSPAYVKRIALVFNNNGYGVRGDMQEVIKAILLDPEARDCSWLDDAQNGKLKQPLERMLNLFRAFDIDSPSGRLWYRDRTEIFEKVEQAFLFAPTVFNFFSPFYAEDEFVEPNNMVSPEFEILHAVTVIHYLNLMENGIKNYPFNNRTEVNTINPVLKNNNSDRPFLDFSDEIALLDAQGIMPLLDRLDIVLCNGQLSDTTKTLIENTLEQLVNAGSYDSEDIVHNALYFIMASPDFMILE